MLKQLLEKQARTLKPTATVVRRNNGSVVVEREDLLSEEDRKRRVDAAAAGLRPYSSGRLFVFNPTQSK